MFTTMFARIAIAVFALVISAGLAFAAVTLDSAKKQGLVGEQQDGLLGIVGTPNAELDALVQNTNTERLSKYQSIAAKNGTAIDQVQALAGKKLIEGAAPGEYIKNAAGSWQKK